MCDTATKGSQRVNGTLCLTFCDCAVDLFFSLCGLPLSHARQINSGSPLLLPPPASPAGPSSHAHDGPPLHVTRTQCSSFDDVIRRLRRLTCREPDTCGQARHAVGTTHHIMLWPLLRMRPSSRAVPGTLDLLHHRVERALPDDPSTHLPASHACTCTPTHLQTRSTKPCTKATAIKGWQPAAPVAHGEGPMDAGSYSHSFQQSTSASTSPSTSTRTDSSRSTGCAPIVGGFCVLRPLVGVLAALISSR